jgi:prolyl-tRNA synthetase
LIYNQNTLSIGNHTHAPLVATFYSNIRQAPADAEVTSHKLLVRAGDVRQLGAGIYSFLFMGNDLWMRSDGEMR